MPKKINKKILAFTLIELLVVIAIIGILSVVAIISLNNGRASARDAKRIADVSQIQTALEIYFNDNKSYPTTEQWGTQIATGTDIYLGSIPVAPTVSEGECGTSSAAYIYESDGKTYSLKFCTGSKVGDYIAGEKEATPDGILAIATVPLPSPPVYEYQVTTTSVLVMHFNGNSNDSTPNSINGIDSNITYVGTGMGQGASFNGTNSKIDLGKVDILNSLGTKDYVMSVWIKPSTMVASAVILRNWSLVEPKKQWELYWDLSGKASYYLYYNSSVYLHLQSDNNFSLGQWYNFIATRKSGIVYFYVNGIFQKSQSRPENLSNLNNLTTLGYANPENSGFFSGLMDELVIEFDKSWTAQEISDYYQKISPVI